MTTTDARPQSPFLLAVGLLFAGHETTVNRIGLGTLLLMTRREHWDALVADPDGRVDDPDREEEVHLAVGHGPRFCTGTGPARIELGAVFATLAKRLPGLRPAEDLDAIEVRADHVTGGVTELPVPW